MSDLRVFFTSLHAALSPLVIIASNRKVNGRLRCVAQEKSVVEKATGLSTVKPSRKADCAEEPDIFLKSGSCVGYFVSVTSR